MQREPTVRKPGWTVVLIIVTLIALQAWQISRIVEMQKQRPLELTSEAFSLGDLSYVIEDLTGGILSGIAFGTLPTHAQYDKDDLYDRAVLTGYPISHVEWWAGFIGQFMSMAAWWAFAFLYARKLKSA